MHLSVVMGHQSVYLASIRLERNRGNLRHRLAAIGLSSVTFLVVCS